MDDSRSLGLLSPYGATCMSEKDVFSDGFLCACSDSVGGSGFPSSFELLSI